MKHENPIKRGHHTTPQLTAAEMRKIDEQILKLLEEKWRTNRK